MPLHLDKLFTSGAHIWIWHLTETKDALQKFIPEGDFFKIEHLYRHPVRQLQKLVTRVLIHRLGEGKYIDIQYDELGKPHPVNYPGHISISHSRHFIGLLYHPIKPCGLDIEEFKDRIVQVAPRFMNTLEQDWIPDANDVKSLTLIWSVKESLYKTIGGGGIHFKEQLLVHRPQFSEHKGGHGTAFYLKGNERKTYAYHYIDLEDVLLVHTIAIESEGKI